MLVIISDVHLTDGSSGETIKEGAFRILRDRLSDMAYDASWRMGDRYRPIDQVDLLLLGDILDVIRSSSWLDSDVRPWNDPRSRQFVDLVSSITDGILTHNCESLQILAGLGHGDAITIPPATRTHKPAKVSREPDDPERLPVRVNIHYLLGNHDWFYNVDSPVYEPIRRKVISAMGLCHSPEDPLPHDPFESDLLMETFSRHRVFARHGDIFDSFNFEGDREASSLGDAIVVELLNRFPLEVKKQLKDHLSPEFLAGLDEIDNVRPLPIVPLWVAGLLQRTCESEKLKKAVKKIWDDCAEQFLSLKFVRDRDNRLNPFQNVDRLQTMLKFSRGVSVQTAGRILQAINRWWPCRAESYRRFAMGEKAFKNRDARHIVYGHTHHHEIVPLDVSQQDTQTLTQMYINSGTWRQVHELAEFNPSENEFVGYKVLTYLGFYKDDERRGRTFESWSGALGE
jgi:hypothetical protein